MNIENNNFEGMLGKLNKKGLAAFFRNDNKVPTLFKDYLLFPDQFDNYPDDIKQRRNTLIYLIGWQIIASFFAMCYILIRRSYIYFFVNILSIGLAVIGLAGILQMKAIFLLAHCLLTTSITGGFFFFQIIDFLLVSDTTYGAKKRLGDDLLLIIFSLPYLYDAFTGLSNFNFLYKISLLNKEKNAHQQVHEAVDMRELDNIDNQQIEDHIKDEKLCIICCLLEKKAVLNPCGHMLCCIDCAEILMKRKSLYSFNNPRCPICRVDINSYLRLRE